MRSEKERESPSLCFIVLSLIRIDLMVCSLCRARRVMWRLCGIPQTKEKAPKAKARLQGRTFIRGTTPIIPRVREGSLSEPQARLRSVTGTPVPHYCISVHAADSGRRLPRTAHRLAPTVGSLSASDMAYFPSTSFKKIDIFNHTARLLSRDKTKKIKHF